MCKYLSCNIFKQINCNKYCALLTSSLALVHSPDKTPVEKYVESKGRHIDSADSLFRHGTRNVAICLQLGNRFL